VISLEQQKGYILHVSFVYPEGIRELIDCWAQAGERKGRNKGRYLSCLPLFLPFISYLFCPTAALDLTV
jgi:hypothetical protein